MIKSLEKFHKVYFDRISISIFLAGRYSWARQKRTAAATAKPQNMLRVTQKIWSVDVVCSSVAQMVVRLATTLLLKSWVRILMVSLIFFSFA